MVSRREHDRPPLPPCGSVELSVDDLRYAHDAKDRAYSCNPSQRCVYGGIGSIRGDQTSSRGADQFAGL
jgi:hypothetical protein